MPPSPPDPRRLPPRDFAQEEQAARLLTAANIHFRRGQIAEAEKSVKELLQSRPEDAAAHELLADIRLSRSDYEGAEQSLKQALAGEPGRASAEAKLGRVALRRHEIERIKTMGVAYAASSDSLMRLSGNDRQSGRRAAFASALLPGLGQYLNGELIKGIVLAVVYFLALLLLSLTATPNGHGRHGPSLSFSGFSWFLLIVAVVDWLYAIGDAAQASQRRADSPSDKDGRQV